MHISMLYQTGSGHCRGKIDTGDQHADSSRVSNPSPTLMILWLSRERTTARAIRWKSHRHLHGTTPGESSLREALSWGR
jgi:hypothetical protein